MMKKEGWWWDAVHTNAVEQLLLMNTPQWKKLTDESLSGCIADMQLQSFIRTIHANILCF